MSYILDALKKIENEKIKKSRPDGSLSISGDLFQERKRTAARTGIWKIAAVVVLASLVTFAGTWFIFQGNGTIKSGADMRPAAGSLPAPVAPVATAPAIPVPVQSPVIPAAAPAAVPPVAAPPRQIEIINSETAPNDDSPVTTVRRLKKGTGSPPSSPRQTVQTVPAPADIKLSGIAWQEERAARRAVVNGFLLKEGSVVAGATISDIQADRVRFLSPAGLFEVKLDAVLPAEGRR